MSDWGHLALMSSLVTVQSRHHGDLSVVASYVILVVKCAL